MLRTLALLACLLAAAAAESRGIFVNQKVSSRTVALNQPVHIELTTVPRQVEGVDIASGVADAITLNAAQAWRLIGKPAVQQDEKTKTLRVSANLLARSTGEFALPTIPLAWLNGDQVADFGAVKVDDQILVGSEMRPLPAEVATVHGWAWGTKLADAQPRLPAGCVTTDKDRAVAKPAAGIELVFRGGELCEAQILAPELTLESARSSFLGRWGAPQLDEANATTWILGWVRVTAAPAADGKGIALQLVREDTLARLTKQRIGDQVFSLLDGPAAPASK